MNKLFIPILIFALCGCTYTATPRPIEPDMVLNFHSDSAIQIINSQTTEAANIENLPIRVNLKAATDAAIALLKEELKKKGVEYSNSSAKALALSLEKLTFRNDLIPTECTATFLVKTGSGVSKKFIGHQDLVMRGVTDACDIAITKATVSIINDQEIRSFIDPTLHSDELAKNQEIHAEHREILRVPVNELILPEGMSAPIAFHYSVRLAKPTDMATLERLRSESRKLLGTSLGISTIGVVEAFVIPGFFSGSLIAGAIFITPLALTLAAIDQHNYNSIEEAFEQTELVPLTQQRLALRTDVASATQNAEGVMVELIITSYGLTYEPVCLFADAAIIVKNNGQPFYEELVYIEPYLRSADASPPICASAELFAHDSGALIKRGLNEYSQVLSAILLKRTRALSW